MSARENVVDAAVRWYALRARVAEVEWELNDFTTHGIGSERAAERRLCRKRTELRQQWAQAKDALRDAVEDMLTGDK